VPGGTSSESAIGRGKRRSKTAAGDLLERESALVAIDQVLADARRAAGSLLVVESPPGIGKSSVLTAAAGAGQSAGMTVLRAVGDELERDFVDRQ
jgi:hypothetical protein